MKFLSFFLILSFHLLFSFNMFANEAVENQPPIKNHFEIKAGDNDTDHFFNEFINMMTTLGIIVAIVFIGTWFLKKILNTRIEQLNTSSLIKVIERRPINPKTTIFLLEIKGQGVILAESTNGVTQLGHFDINDNEIEPLTPKSFKNLMP